VYEALSYTHTPARLEWEERIACELHEEHGPDIERLAEIARFEELGPDYYPAEWGATSSTTVFPR
jgi:hypothetical protein